MLVGFYPTLSDVARPKARLRDWLFGAPGKRRLLRVLLEEPVPTDGWREADLAGRAELHKKGSVDEHLAALAQLDLVEDSGGRYRLNARSPLVPPLRKLLRELNRVPNDEVVRP
jgi:hypothetical protein